MWAWSWVRGVFANNGERCLRMKPAFRKVVPRGGEIAERLLVIPTVPDPAIFEAMNLLS